LNSLRILLHRPLMLVIPIAVILAVVFYIITTAEVSIITEDGILVVRTHAATVREVMAMSGISLNPEDRGDPTLDTAVTDGMRVFHIRAYPYTLHLEGNSYQVWSSALTTGAFLQHLGIELDTLDEVYPGWEALLAPGQHVKVVRVEKDIQVVEEPIPVPVVTKKDVSMREGTVKVLEEGKPGTVRKEYLVTYADGKERSRELVGEEVIKEAEPQVVAKGTMPESDYVASRGNVGTVLEGVASWYGEDFAGSYTSSGEKFDPDAFTAAHRTFPFGTIVKVTYLKTGRSVNVRINDRGPAQWTGKIIDLSRAAAEAIGMKGAGVGRVSVEIVRLP